MSDAPHSAAYLESLEAEIRAMRAEIAWLQTQRVEQTQQLIKSDRYYQSRVRFQTVFEHSPLGLKIISPDLIIQQANAAIATLLGLANPKDLIGQRILEFAHPNHKADWVGFQDALWARRLPWFSIETQLVRVDGATIWCRATSVLFPEAGDYWGFTTLEDITARKQLEEREQAHSRRLQEATEDLAVINGELRVSNESLLHVNEELMHTNAELDSFVYAASHDLKAPIVNLEGLLLALTQQLPAEALQADQVEYLLNMMQGAVGRFRLTLDSLTDIGTMQVEASKPQERVNLATIIEGVRLNLAPLLAETGGRLGVDLVGSSSLAFSTKNLRSIIYNLVSNALKYRHPDRAPVVHVRSKRVNGGQLLLRVEDNGLGLTPTQQAQLFQLFRRLHSHVEGSGVGLYLVKKILANAGGSICVESQPNRGSTFIVAFPS